jgi:superfamily II DNA or RNA helicase
LGFPKEYAGFEGARRDPILQVEGPKELPALHDFQKQIVTNIIELVDADVPKTNKRGLLSLPTGAGKTRVAVEALVNAMRDYILIGPILWVAQTDELCEQAVQTWNYVWRAVGPEDTLQINRLWSGNEADPFSGDGYQVIVATIAKLQSCIKDPDYDWLKNDLQCLVIDEAHGSTTPEYTQLLNWLDMGRKADRIPLIGLTATPFRGGEDQTRWLVNRYGGKRLDGAILGDDPYPLLQRKGVLAYVDHRELEGSDIHLNLNELDELKRYSRVPTTALDRIGADTHRNSILLNSILSLDPTWPVLLFAASVEHAQTMAALLSSEGVTAAAISGQTDMAVRRHYIEDFRRKKIRVLTNYGVLTTGFDAPSVRAVYVARPTYSPVLYQQMIGRGLRGPKNGGKDRCLIVNVIDNILQYGEELAFRQFEYLWKEQSSF